MAEYCQQCAERLFGCDTQDLSGLCDPGETIWELCEGCGGMVEVDHEGRRVSGSGPQ
jgi:hypothetical protein